MSRHRKSSAFTEEEATKNRIAVALVICAVLGMALLLVFVGLTS
jgi:hypothetical protein